MMTKSVTMHRVFRLRVAIIIAFACLIVLLRKEGSGTTQNLHASSASTRADVISSDRSNNAEYSQPLPSQVPVYKDDGNDGSKDPDIDYFVKMSEQNSVDIAADVAAREEKNTTEISWKDIPCPNQVNEEDRCDLTDTQWGTPVIFLSYGRSRSSVTWDILSALATSSNPDGLWQHAFEDTGGGASTNLKQLEGHPKEHGKCWLETILCRLQARNRERVAKGRGSAIYGTTVF